MDWLTRGPELNIRGERVRVLPAEELIAAKLYILHRDRCDWTDVLNLIYMVGPELDWEHLLHRLGDDWPLLAGAMHVFSWLCPGHCANLPPAIWDRLRMPRPEPGAHPLVDRQHVDWLDTRPWFRAVLEPGEEPFA